MEYQLVLQWRTATLPDFDRLIEIEDLLIEHIADYGEVDGHDIGRNEMNIFIVTDDPKQSFERVKSILKHLDVWFTVRAAYRELLGSAYTILWPKDLTEFEMS